MAWVRDTSAAAQGDGSARQANSGALREVATAFLRLGLTSFGGPVAHIGFFRSEFVARRLWLDDATFGDLVALCQVLPGPASSQVAVCLGTLRAGVLGGLLAWLCFTLPSAIVLVVFADGLAHGASLDHAAWAHGLRIAAVAVVAQALWGMARTLCPDRARASLAVGAAIVAVAAPTTFGQVGAIALGAAVGWRFLPVSVLAGGSDDAHLFAVPRRLAVGALILFAALLVGLQLAARSGNHLIAVVDAFYRSGALVFGGGHVVLPLLQRALVTPGWIGDDVFLAGYGAAQAVPGPLFTFAAFLGAAMKEAPNGWLGAIICLVAIYLPSLLLLFGLLPFWNALRRGDRLRAILGGVNAAVVGLLLAAFYDPVWTSAIAAPRDFIIAAAALLALAAWRLPAWLVVVACALVTAALG